MAEFVDRGMIGRASVSDAAAKHARSVVPTRLPIEAAAGDAWLALSETAIEPNGYYLPAWEAAVSASAKGRTGASVLCAWSETANPKLIGLAPVTSLWRAYRIPLPALVSGHPYGTLCTPLLDREMAADAGRHLLQAAREAGAHALVLRDVSMHGPALHAITTALAYDGLTPRIVRSHERAYLDATRDGDEVLHEALGAKKLKELRRQRRRLAEHGAVEFDIARTPDQVRVALESFLKLEASGWKGRRGTALNQNAGDAAFIRRATMALAKTGQCEIVNLRAGDTPIAAGIVLRHQDRAFFFKIGVEERFAKFSPGVQLTLDLTRHLCADPAITSADSTAGPDHPMINPIWLGRFAIGDVVLPLRTRDPVVELIHAAIVARQSALDLARRAARFVRNRRKV